VVGRVQGVERRTRAKLRADHSEEAQVRRLVPRAAEEEHRDGDRAQLVGMTCVRLAGLVEGKEKKTRPFTPSRGDSEAAVEVSRPPKEWPPARRGKSGTAPAPP
jgi:hypothetical protein